VSCVGARLDRRIGQRVGDNEPLDLGQTSEFRVGLPPVSVLEAVERGVYERGSVRRSNTSYKFEFFEFRAI
jgi:hypothetical protein